MNTLAFGYDLPTAGRSRDFYPLECARAGRTKAHPGHRLPACVRGVFHRVRQRAPAPAAGPGKAPHLLYPALTAGVVHGVVLAAGPRHNQLGDGDEGIALLQQTFNDARQRLRRMLGSVVEQDNGAGLHLGGDPLGNIGGAQVFPIKAVTVRNSFNPLHCNGFPAFTGRVSGEITVDFPSFSCNSPDRLLYLGEYVLFRAKLMSAE